MRRATDTFRGVADIVARKLPKPPDMRPLSEASTADFAKVRFVLTDADDTLTHGGRLSAPTYAALERVQRAQINVIPVSAAPAGWCDQMVCMWPVDAVIGENGGFYTLLRGGQPEFKFWHGAPTLEANAFRLNMLRDTVLARLPDVRVAADQKFRLTSLAFERPTADRERRDLLSLLRAGSARTTVNSMWVLAWLGSYDKLAMARRLLTEAFAADIDGDLDEMVYVGDSGNDAPMFVHFPKSVGVSTIVEHLADIPRCPAWVTAGPGGEGFVEVADLVLRAAATR